MLERSRHAHRGKCSSAAGTGRAREKTAGSSRAVAWGVGIGLFLGNLVSSPGRFRALTSFAKFAPIRTATSIPPRCNEIMLEMSRGAPASNSTPLISEMARQPGATTGIIWGQSRDKNWCGSTNTSSVAPSAALDSSGTATTLGGSRVLGRYFTFTWVVLMISVSFSPLICSSYTHMLTVSSRMGCTAALSPTTRAMAEPQLPEPTIQILYGVLGIGTAAGAAGDVAIRSAFSWRSEATLWAFSRRSESRKWLARRSSVTATTTSAVVPATGPNSSSATGGGSGWGGFRSLKTSETPIRGAGPADDGAPKIDPTRDHAMRADHRILLLAWLGRVTANAYESLGVAPDASAQAIRAAYRRNALANHPDKISPNTSASEREAAARRMELINEAYEAVGEPEARARYDRAQIAYGTTGGASGGYRNRRAPVQARAKLACTLEQMGGFAAATIDLAAVLGPRYAAGAPLPPLRYWLPPGCSAGQVVRVPLDGAGIDLILELEEAKPRQPPLGALLARQSGFTRHGADLDTTLWLPAWHNARWWRRPASVATICGMRATAVGGGRFVTSGEVVTLRGLGMPLRRAGGAGDSPYAMERGALRVELRLRSVSSSLWRTIGSAAVVASAGAAVRKLAPWRWFRWRKRKLVIRLWTGPNPLNVGRPFRVWGRTQLYTYQWGVGG